MRKNYCVIICLCIFSALSVFGNSINIIPYPEKVVKGEGFFIVSPNVKIKYDKKLRSAESLYTQILETNLGTSVIKKGSDHLISLNVDEKSQLPEEGYKITVTTGNIDITASSPKGIFYGIQSLCQMSLKDSVSKVVKIPVATIEDCPRFAWRGCMLDVSRTFMDKKLLMRYIDLMASYKLNVLHFHLIDDQGWRLEIKRYPNLVSVGSKFDTEFNEMGGYYTHEDIRELIEYASMRNITIVPEFEIPGHECAAIASYPELSCRGVRPKIHPYTKGRGIHQEIFCAGKPEVYEFIYNVLDEIIELFPSKYIHIGGDEAPKHEWKQCAHCQKVIKENGLKNEEELQSYLVYKVGEYICKKGKEVIGWDEILEGGKLSGDEIVMYWRGLEGKMPEIQKAAQDGFKIISCPNAYYYLDYNYKRTDTQKAYFYEPIPQGTPTSVASNYVGVQANFWSHIDRSENCIDRQLFPRMFAIAETAWSSAENKDWNRFKEIVKIHIEKLRSKHINCHYDESVYNPE